MSGSSTTMPARLAIGIAAALLLAGCSTAGPRAVPMTEVGVGDCFDADEAFTTAFVYADCDDPHLFEAYWVERVEGDAFPGDEAVRSRADTLCDEQFRAFSGRDDYASMFLGPNSATWEVGDRSIVCVTMPVDRQPRAGSAAADPA